MRSLNFASGALCLLVLAPAGALWAGEPAGENAAKAAPPAESLLPAWIQFGGQVRGRFEGPSGTGAEDTFLTRVRANVLVKPAPWLKMFVQGQDTRAIGYDKPVPGGMQNSLDLRQAYIELSGEGKESSMVRVGRQEIALGGGRLIGQPDWGNTVPGVDGARAALSVARAKLDVFTFSPVNADDSRFDQHKAGLHYYGAYLTLSKILPHSKVEPYYFMKRQINVTGERGDLGNLTLSTVGGRMTGKLPGRLDYSAELARQFGRSARDMVSAVAGNYVLGWTVSQATWKPRVSAEFTHASGDSANKDGRRGTFDQLQASNHLNYGIADVMGWRNMRTFRTGFDVVAGKKLKLQTDWNDFYLATVQDGLYNAAGTRLVLNRKATSAHVGNEIDLFGSYQIARSLTYGTGIAHLFAGQYLKQSANKSYGYWIPYVFCTKTF